jgi:hypothetical protein
MLLHARLKWSYEWTWHFLIIIACPMVDAVKVRHLSEYRLSYFLVWVYRVGRVILASYLAVDAGVLDSVKTLYSNTHIHQVFHR